MCTYQKNNKKSSIVFTPQVQVPVDKMLRRGNAASATTTPRPSPEKRLAPRDFGGGGKGGGRGAGGEGCDTCAEGCGSAVDAAGERAAGACEEALPFRERGEGGERERAALVMGRGADGRSGHGASVSLRRPEAEAAEAEAEAEAEGASAESLMKEAFDRALLHLVTHVMPSLHEPASGCALDSVTGEEGGGTHGKTGGAVKSAVVDEGVRSQVLRELENAGEVLKECVAAALACGDERGAERLVEVAFHLLLRLWARPACGDRSSAGALGRRHGPDGGGGLDGRAAGGTEERGGEGEKVPGAVHGGGDGGAELAEWERARKRAKTGGTSAPRVAASASAYADAIAEDLDGLVSWMVSAWSGIVENVLAEV